MLSRILLGSLVTLALVQPAAAGQTLGPQRAGDLTVVRTQFNPCPIGGGHTIDWMDRNDGTSAALAIPAGKVLVLTEIETSTIALVEDSAGHGLNLLLERQVGTSNQMVGYTSGVYDAGSQFAHTFVFPNGLVVRPGVTLCAVAFRGDVSAETPVTAVAHGFFAKDD